jgi:hypothetical protein
VDRTHRQGLPPSPWYFTSWISKRWASGASPGRRVPWSDHCSYETFRKITKMRESAEAVHGKEAIARVTREYVEARVELIERPLAPSRKRELQELTRLLELKYGYAVLTGAPRITGGNHPVHDWRAQLESISDVPPATDKR